MEIMLTKFIGLLGLILAIQAIIIYIGYKINGGYKANNKWLIGSSLISLAYITISIFTKESLIKSIMIGKPIVIIGYIFIYTGIKQFSNGKLNTWVSIYILIVFNLFYYYYYMFIENINSAQIVIISFTIAIVLFKIVHELLFRKNKFLSTATNFIAGVFLIYGSTNIISRFLIMIQSPISSYVNLVYILLIAFTSSIIIISDFWVFGFILMVNYKLIKEKELGMEKLIHQLEREKNEAEESAIIDNLTGLYNRKYFDKMLKREFFRLMRSESKLSLIMLEIDDFEKFNDSYGDLAGDKCVQSISDMLKNTVERAPDIISLYDRGEFILILPETDEKGAKLLGGKIREKVEKLDIPHRTSETSNYVTVSVGVTTVNPAYLSNPEEVLKMLNDALYEAKSKGGNTCVYTSNI